MYLLFDSTKSAYVLYDTSKALQKKKPILHSYISQLYVFPILSRILKDSHSISETIGV
jgi:hypothetical protein